MNAGKMIIGIMAGAAIGATLGVLYAPDSGSKTRKKILTKKDAYVTELENKFNDFVETVSGRFESLKRETTQMLDHGKTGMQDGLSKSHASVK